MALLNAVIPTFLTHHRNLTQLPCCARLFSRTCRYSDAAAGRPPSTAARRRLPFRLASTAGQKKGTRRQAGLEVYTQVVSGRRGAAPDAHGCRWRALSVPTPRRGPARAAAATRAYAATGACRRPGTPAARAAVWVACVERAGPRPTPARWPRGRPAARSAEGRFSVPARGARLRPLGRRGGAARRLQAGRGWPGGGGWSCQGRAEQRGRAPGPAAVAAARGLACMRMFCSWRYNRGCISGSGDE